MRRLTADVGVSLLTTTESFVSAPSIAPQALGCAYWLDLANLEEHPLRSAPVHSSVIFTLPGADNHLVVQVQERRSVAREGFLPGQIQRVRCNIGVADRFGGCVVLMTNVARVTQRVRAVAFRWASADNTVCRHLTCIVEQRSMTARHSARC